VKRFADLPFSQKNPAAFAACETAINGAIKSASRLGNLENG